MQVKPLKFKAGDALGPDEQATQAATAAERASTFRRSTPLSCQGGCTEGLQVTLQPMEIRTFFLQLS